MEEKVEKALQEEEAGETPETEAAEEQPRKTGRIKSKNKVIRKRKSKKEKENPLSGAIRLAVESGKVGFGSKEGVKSLLLGKAKLVVISSNAPKALLEDVRRFSSISHVPLVVFVGTSIELGSICGRPFSVSVLSVYDAGVSNIMEFGKKEEGAKD